MLQKDISSFIKAIRGHDNTAVRRMLDEMPELIASKAKSPPKKDDGQSPLQVAFKVGNFEAASVLVERGADPDYIEVSDINEWRAPVLHDALRATIFNCKTLQKDPAQFEVALALVRRLLELGAKPNKEDSYGNSGAMRAALDARQLIAHPAVDKGPEGSAWQISRVFSLLREFGADIDHPTERRAAVRKMLASWNLEELVGASV